MNPLTFAFIGSVLGKKLFGRKHHGDEESGHHHIPGLGHHEDEGSRRGGMWNYFQPSYYIPRRSIHHRHLVVFLLGLTIILLVILISGSSSAKAAGPSLYLVEFQYDSYGESQVTGEGIVNSTAYNKFNNEVKGTKLLTRVGYFGVCTKIKDSGDWICSSVVTDATKKAKGDQDPLNLIYMAYQMRSGAVSPWVMIIGTILIFCCMVALIVSHSAQSMALPVATACNVAGFLFILIGMVWQQTAAHTMSKAVATLSHDAIKAGMGTPAAGLGWTSCFFVAMCAGGMGIILSTEKAIEHETGESHGVVKGGGGGMAPPPMGGGGPGMVDRHSSHHSHHPSLFSRGRSMSRHSLRDGLEPEVRMPSPRY